MKGLVAFSFALREADQEPNPCNVRLAQAVERIVAGEGGDVIVVAQWEVARQLQADAHVVACSVGQPSDGSYLNSEMVWDKAKALFRQRGVKEVIPVAQPFLQAVKVRRLITADDFVVADRPIGRIGFDKQSTQWWTRGPVRLLCYAIRQQFTN